MTTRGLRCTLLRERRREVPTLPAAESGGCRLLCRVRSGARRSLPGLRPLEALAGVLARLIADDVAPVARARELGQALARPGEDGTYEGLRRIADLLPGVAESPIVLLIDQFEELYSLCEKPAERDAFIGNLLTAAADRMVRVSIILTMRSDFLGHTLSHGSLHDPEVRN